MASALNSPRAVGQDERTEQLLLPGREKGKSAHLPPSHRTPAHPTCQALTEKEQQAAGPRAAGVHRYRVADREEEEEEKEEDNDGAAERYEAAAPSRSLCAAERRGSAVMKPGRARNRCPSPPLPPAAHSASSRPPVPRGNAPRCTGAPSARTPPPGARAAIIFLSANIAAWHSWL